MKKSLNTSNENKSKQVEKITVETTINNNPVKTWINFDEWKALDAWTKERELKLGEWMRYGRKTN